MSNIFFNLIYLEISNMKIVSLITIVMIIAVGGCSHPIISTNYKAKNRYAYSLVVLPPVDRRSEHYGEQIANTIWKAGTTDSLANEDTVVFIQHRMANELRSSGLFSAVNTKAEYSSEMILKTEIQAFCSERSGFGAVRIVGITVLRVTLEKDGKVIFDHKFEKVITDADQNYSGLQLTWIKEAMKIAMTDSLRELIRDMLGQIEADAVTWSKPI